MMRMAFKWYVQYVVVVVVVVAGRQEPLTIRNS
jgi:hypothetical protein